MKTLKFLLIIALSSLISCGSGGDSVTDPVKLPLGNLISNSECKSGKSESILNYQNFEDAIEWNFDNGTLTLKHVNAAFNCCPGKLSGLVSISSGKIEINESEEKTDCKCNCLYDLTFQIKNLNAGVFTITINEPYLVSPDAKISFQVDLTAQPRGSKIFSRTRYPWI